MARKKKESRKYKSLDTEYANVMATMAEVQEQHSYFQNDIHEIKKNNEEKVEKSA